MSNCINSKLSYRDLDEPLARVVLNCLVNLKKKHIEIFIVVFHIHVGVEFNRFIISRVFKVACRGAYRKIQRADVRRNHVST